MQKEHFYKAFKGHSQSRVDRLWSLYTTKPKTAKDLVKNYLPSKFWRLNNLYKITDKEGSIVTFKLNLAQLRIFSKTLEHPRLIILKSRQQGISTFYLLHIFDDFMVIPNLNCGLMAQDQDSAKTLLERVKFLLDNLDPTIKNFFGLKVKVDNTKELTLSNGSSLFIRTSFRSATLHRLHVSELGKIANKSPEKAKETNTGTLQTIAPGNLIALESTAEGNNMFKSKWDSAVKQYKTNKLAGKDFLPVFLSWVDDPTCVEVVTQESDDEADLYFTKVERSLKLSLTQQQKNFWIAQRRELSGDIYQEYPATAEEAFAAAKDGTYWSRLYVKEVLLNDRKVESLYDKHLPVYVIQDLGRKDYYVILFFQLFNDQIRIVGEYYNSGEDIRHYADKIHEKANLGWDIQAVVFPHDGAVVDLSAHNMTREEIFNECGIRNTLILPKTSVQSSIELVREHMSKIWIDEDCTYINDCFLNYTKEWNELLAIWRDLPLKNGYQHGADALRYMVQYVQTYLEVEDYDETYGMSGGLQL